MHNRFLQSLTGNLLIVSFLLSSLGQVGRITPFPQIHFYVFEPVLFFAVGLIILQIRKLPLHKIRTSELTLAVRYFLLWLLISLGISMVSFTLKQNVSALLYFLRLAFYCISLPYIITWISIHKKTHALLMKSIFLFFGIVILSALLQYFYYPNLRNLIYAGWDPHYYRLFGMYFEPVIFATIAGLFFLSFILGKKTIAVFAASTVCLAAVLASYSRAVYIGLLTAVITAFGDKVPWKQLLLFGVIIVIVYMALPKPSGEGVNLLRTSTIQSRSEDYLQGWKLFVSNPVVGIGYNHIGAVKHYSIPDNVTENNAAGSFHSSFLIIAVTSGLIGLLLFINVLYHLTKINRYFFVAIIFLSVVSLFDNVLLHPFIIVALLFLGSAKLNLSDI